MPLLDLVWENEALSACTVFEHECHAFKRLGSPPRIEPEPALFPAKTVVMSDQTQAQPVQTTVERRCRRLFSRLHRLGEKLKRHDHQPAHFNIQNALQHVEAQGIQTKFTEKAIIKGQGECKDAEKALYVCVTHLDSCIKTCQIMGTPQWTSNHDSTLSDGWTLFVANFNHATRLLDLPELDLRPFLAIQAQTMVTTPLPSPSSGLTRRDSDQSESSSRAETIENWNAMRDRQDRIRLAALRAQRQGPLGMTATGTRFQRLPLRPASVLSFSTIASSTSTSASLASTISPPPTPAVAPPAPAPPAPAAPKIAEALASKESVVSSRPPPPYSPNPSIKITPDDKSDPDTKYDWDTKTLVSSPMLHKRAQSDSGIQSLRRAASDVSLSSTASSSSAHFHFHAGSNASFHLQPPWPGNLGPRPTMPPPPMMPGPYQAPPHPAMSAPALMPIPQGPSSFGFQPAPPPPALRQMAYKASRTSLRETAALHMLRQGAPGVVLHAVKPEVTCGHGVVHFKQHAYCGWDNCCNMRGCGV